MIILLLNIFFINTFSYQINASTEAKEIIKIGVYEDEPYISIDDKGNISGYYYDLINLLKKEYDFQPEYVICNPSDALKMLEDGDIDVIFGLAMTDDRKEKFIFNKYRICVENNALITKLDIEFKDLKNPDNVRLGLVEHNSNSEFLLDFFESNGINLIPVYATNFDELKKLLDNDEIDIILSSAINNKDYNIIYRFTAHQVYIAGNKNSKHILDKFDNAIESLGNKKNSKIYKLYKKYFFTFNNTNLEEIILISSNVCLLLLTLLLVIPKLKLRSIRNKVKLNLNNNSYFLYYQPIYNPRNNSVVAFEGLLRLKDRDNNIIPPSKFISEIENSNMLFEVSLWILEQAIKDYKILKRSTYFSNKDFYISINVSLSEIENKEFVYKAIKILANSNIGNNKICLEIIEKVKINDLSKITKYIKILKNAGFKIAIDDFGVEYSNLDIIRKLDFDIIKIDKYFIDTICKDVLHKNIILFINTLASSLGKSVVLEGIEEAEQHNLIKSINNENLYVQGYFYSKPRTLADIFYSHNSINDNISDSLNSNLEDSLNHNSPDSETSN